jgi:Na+-transporting methylmalonyl-CoA/oxaloacetate decarboxylase gamma subunit
MPEWIVTVAGVGFVLLAILSIVFAISILGSISTILQMMAADRKELRARNEEKHKRFLRSPQTWRENED